MRILRDERLTSPQHEDELFRKECMFLLTRFLSCQPFCTIKLCSTFVHRLSTDPKHTTTLVESKATVNMVRVLFAAALCALLFVSFAAIIPSDNIEESVRKTTKKKVLTKPGRSPAPCVPTFDWNPSSC